LAVGKSGTLLFPAFNFDFTEGASFDILNTPSQMGALSEAARVHSKSIRTGHPIYSFSVIGALAPLFKEVNNFSGYGDDSPFSILLKNKGKIASIDLSDDKCMTFYHFVEEMEGVPYRYNKIFTGKYIDENGVSKIRSYQLFVRDVDNGVNTDVAPMEDYLWDSGIYKGFRPGHGNGLRVVETTELFSATKKIIRERKACGMLYSFNKKK
jgi:aminoglycoside 3-N-acetyltransferase